jgi:hypothetical protein
MRHLFLSLCLLAAAADKPVPPQKAGPTHKKRTPRAKPPAPAQKPSAPAPSEKTKTAMA